MLTLLKQALARRANQPQVEPDPTTYPPLQIPQPQTEEQRLASYAQALLEGLEECCDRKEFIYFEPEHAWTDTEEGDVTSASAVVLVVRGKRHPVEQLEAAIAQAKGQHAS